MLPRWGHTIPVAVFMLSACSVYDASLLATNAVVSGGAGGSAGSLLGNAGLSSAAAGADSDAGAGGVPADEPDAGGNSATGGVGASGGASGNGGTAAAGVGGGVAGSGAAPVLDLENIDTMEDNNAAIEYVGTRNGDWYAGHDATATGMQFPGSAFVMSALDKADPRYAQSKYAAMTKGSGFTDWGEDLGFNLMLVNATTGKHPTYDASAYCGVRFFAHVGTGASSSVIVRVPDKNSLPDGGVCGVGGMPCYLSFQKVSSFTTTWTEYDVLFSDLRNNGWATALAQNAIYGLEFGLSPSSVFELWVDDVSFLKKPAGGACPASYP